MPPAAQTPPPSLEPATTLDRIAELLRHDARNPLYALTLSSRILQSGNAATLEEGTRLSRRSLARVSAMMLQLQLLSTFSTGGVRIERSRVDLAGLIKSGIRAAGPQVQGAEIQMSVPQDDVLLADPGLLRFAVQTIAHNAVVHGTGAVVVQAAASERDGVEILVRHDGDLKVPTEALFDPMKSCGKPDTQAGLGLGLALTSMAMHAHRGYLHMYADGRQVVTQLTLPDGETL